jgi:hypothetical protein
MISSYVCRMDVRVRPAFNDGQMCPSYALHSAKELVTGCLSPATCTCHLSPPLGSGTAALLTQQIESLSD